MSFGHAATRALDPKKSRNPVLILAHSDGFLEVFGDGIDTKIVNVPSTGTVKGEIIAEEFISLSLPPRFKAIYLPGMLRAVGNVRTITPRDLDDVRFNMLMIRAMDTLSTVASGEVTSCTLS